MIRSLWFRAAVGAWAILLAAVCIKPLFKPVSGTVYVTFAHAGEEFAAGRRLYDVMHPNTDNFRYAPVVAAGFVPFSYLPLGVGGALWRVLGAAVFLTGLAAWGRRVCPTVPQPLFFLLALPLSIGSLSNGQANTHVIGLMLWAGLLAARGRWPIAAILVAAAALFKGYPVALGMLLALAAPIRFGIPFALAIGAGVGLPFLLQSPEYVADQYRYWAANLSRDDRSSMPLWAGYQDFHMLLRVVGLDVTRADNSLVQVGMGAAAAGVVAAQLWKGIDRGQVALNALSLGLCWMALFGPATESSTFILLAPVMAREVLDRAGRPVWAKASAFLGPGCFLASVLIFAFPHHIHRPVIALGIQPLGALFLSIAAVARVMSTRPAAPAAMPAVEPTLRQAA